MTFTIEIEDRDWDTDQIVAALKIPAARGYIAELTIDEPSHGEGVFHGDVALQALDGDVLVVVELVANSDGVQEAVATHRFDVADIRRISFY